MCCRDIRWKKKENFNWEKIWKGLREDVAFELALERKWRILKTKRDRERILGWRDSMSKGPGTWKHVAHSKKGTQCGVGDKVRNISGCFITFILDFIKKNGEAWFNFENREAWKDLCFQKVTLAVCQISNCSSSSPRERKYINRTATKTSDTSFSEFQIEMLGIRMGLSWGTVGFRIAATGQRSIM